MKEESGDEPKTTPEETTQRLTLSERALFVKYWGPFDKGRFELLRHKLDVLKPAGKLDENDPETQEYIWQLFCDTRACNNYLLLLDKNDSCITRWFLHFRFQYPLIGFVVNYVAINYLKVRAVDARWNSMRSRHMDMALHALAQTVEHSDSIAEMATCLICIMFLLSERSATRSSTWRIHLRGALAILRRCDALHSTLMSLGLENMSMDTQYASQMYSFAKNWFVTAETIACLSAPNGGAITDIEESNAILSYTSYDIDAGFYYGGFNLMKGYSQSLTPVLVELIQLTFRARQDGGAALSGTCGIVQSMHTDEYLRTSGRKILVKLNEAEKERFDLTKISDHKLRASIRACHLSFCAALRIFVLAVLLDKHLYGSEIQENVQNIEEQLVATSSVHLIGLCIHWPVFIAALCSPPGSLRVVLMDELQLICSNGTYVARNTVERIHRAWACLDSGDVLSEEGYDCIVL